MPKWSNEFAYILGLWFATQENRKIILPKKDKYILKKISGLLKCGAIEKEKNSSKLSLSIEDTRYWEVYVKELPKEFKSHFIRGFFEGCGDFLEIKKNRINTIFTFKDKNFLIHLLAFLRTQGVSAGSINESLKLGKKDTSILGSFIYKECGDLYLSRKKNKLK